MDMRFKDELALMPDLRHRLRRLRWFRATFRANAKAVSTAYGLRFQIDDTSLTRAFLDWIEIVETQKRFAEVDRADFIVFAAGLVLRELIRQNPAKVLAKYPDRDSMSPQENGSEIVDFWPEGFLYTNYCVTAVAAIHEQEFGTAPTIDKCADDLRTWWSYRENVAEMPAYAVAFLDRFLGSEPNWIAPDQAASRRAIQKIMQSRSPAIPGDNASPY